MQKSKWDEAKVLIEETDLLIGMNPGSSIKHREIEELQKELKSKFIAK